MAMNSKYNCKNIESDLSGNFRKAALMPPLSRRAAFTDLCQDIRIEPQRHLLFGAFVEWPASLHDAIPAPA